MTCLVSCLLGRWAIKVTYQTRKILLGLLGRVFSHALIELSPSQSFPLGIKWNNWKIVQDWCRVWFPCRLCFHISPASEEKTWKICQLFEPELSFYKRWIALCAGKNLIQHIGIATRIHWMVIYQVDGLYILNNLSFLFIFKQVFFLCAWHPCIFLSCSELMAPKNVETITHLTMN